MPPTILCLAHLVAGLALVLVGGILTAYGHSGVGADIMIGAGATLLPTAPSGLLRAKSTGSLVNDTIAAMQAGAAATVLGHSTTPPPAPLAAAVTPSTPEGQQ